VTIKAEVEKLLKSGFIYPVPLTEWVSNIVLVTKKQGTIRVYVDYRDLNKDCPKDNYPTPFIDQIIDNCAGSVIFSFMDGFSGYNQIDILPIDQHKTTFICLWGTFAYQNYHLALKMLVLHSSGHVICFPQYQTYCETLPRRLTCPLIQSIRPFWSSTGDFSSMSVLPYSFEPT
jgi:hypothetical protein